MKAKAKLEPGDSAHKTERMNLCGAVEVHRIAIIKVYVLLLVTAERPIPAPCSAPEVSIIICTWQNSYLQERGITQKIRVISCRWCCMCSSRMCCCVAWKWASSSRYAASVDLRLLSDGRVGVQGLPRDEVHE